MKTGLLLAGLRINFNRRAPLAGFITPCLCCGLGSFGFNFYSNSQLTQFMPPSQKHIKSEIGSQSTVCQVH